MNYEDIVRKIKDISGYDPSEMPGPDAPLQAAKGAMRVRDSVIGAPTRAALQAMQRGESMGDAFTKQFGENPDTAPTGKQLLKNDPNTAQYADSDALGLAVEVAADPTLATLPRFPKIRQTAKITPTAEGGVTSRGIEELRSLAEVKKNFPKSSVSDVAENLPAIKRNPGMNDETVSLMVSHPAISPELAIMKTNPNEMGIARLEKRLDKFTPEYYYDTEAGKLIHDPKLLKADEATKDIIPDDEAYKKLLEMMKRKKKG